jgi:hypothetical protein
MSTIDLQSVCDALRELSSVEQQKRLWTSTGASNSEVSSFVEVVEQLYTDTGLSTSLAEGTTGFSEDVDKLLIRLASMLKQVDVKNGPWRTIEDPAMIAVRETAGKILGIVTQRSDGALRTIFRP